MADTTKAQKLAAARKKLKEYQQKSQKPNKKVPEYEANLGTCETLSTSTHSSVNGNLDASDAVPSESANNSHPAQVSPFHNYFNGSRQSIFYQEPVNFFDNLSTYNQKSNDDPTSNIDKTITNSNYFEGTNNMQTCFSDDGNYVSPIVISDDVTALGYPEIKQNDIYGYFRKIEQTEHPTVSSEDAKKLSEYLEIQKKGSVEDLACNSILESCAASQDSPHQDEHAVQSSLQLFDTKSLNSNTESLRQLSSQITELIKDEVTSIPQQTNELEQRNQELAALLEQERLESQKLQTRLHDSQNRIAQLELESQQSRIDYEHRLNRELGPLQEQLQCHAQTVGILVGEKTELSTTLSQSQLVAKQKMTECEELQGRLKTSRSRVADLEKESQVLKSERSKFEQNHTQEEEINKLKKEYQELKEQKDEAAQDLLELREKLNVKVNENLALQQEVQEISHQLSLAQVKIEQITAGENLQVESQIEILTKQKLTLEKQVLELSQALKATGEERDQASVQYQHYVQQLNGQVASLASKLESMTAENESLANREQNLVKHIGELEKHLQNIQEERLNFATSRGTSSETKKELESALESIQNLQMQKNKIEENYQHVLSEREDLLREVESKKELMEQLEIQLERLQGDQPDSAKLLAAMESDKVAAARAVAQNSQLKQELEEMQQAFVKMSNDKLELTEKLTSEEYRSKDLFEKLSHTENQLHTLSDAIVIKDNELTQMRETLIHQNKQILQQDQLADRLRHYEAQDGSSHALQVELQKAQDHTQQLIKENTKLKEDLENVNMQINYINPNPSPQQEHSQLCNKEATASPLESEHSGTKTANEYNTGSKTINGEPENLDLNILDKEVAMKHLEEKFTRTMLDIANLTEEKQRLEHIVTQLQGETETIGEYIALYQHQRGVLKQRTQEKDEQLKRLAQDREKVLSKLDVLNELVKKLVLEKGVLTPEILEQHKKLNSQSHELCSEHAKIQQEINKIAEQSLPSADSKEEAHLNDNNNLSAETAEEIIALLAEIKSSNLIQPSDGLENFHPCPWCSGQLLIV